VGFTLTLNPTWGCDKKGKGKFCLKLTRSFREGVEV
jgi:hypothetical protein